jgi:small subunit ribosomal protein S1
MSESFAELFEQSLTVNQLQPGTIITGTVVAITSEVVVVNAGLKSEGIIPRSQFLDVNGNLECAVGDEVRVALEAVEDGSGATRLSREKAKRHAAWEFLDKAFEAGEAVKGIINGKVKGGFTVELDSVRAFLPGSLVDVRPVRDTSYLEGKELEFKVIKLDRKRNNVVVSRRAVVEDEYSAEREALLEKLEEGMQVKGVVKNLTDYGAFVDLGGIDGLLHITDMAWRRVKHPSEVVEVGDEIDVKVLKFDRERQRVSLGLKQMGEDPWVNISRRYPRKHPGLRQGHQHRRLRLLRGDRGGRRGSGARLRDGLDQQERPSGKIVALGDEVEVMVLDIDEERRRISLGIKQCAMNPWDEFALNHKKGDHVSGKIKSITDFGIFIGLDGGIDGLVHLSDISWEEGGDQALRRYQKGDELETVVLSVDPERERISLGVKQLDKDPFSAFVAAHEKGSIVNGTIMDVDAKGATIALGDGVEGYLRSSEISRDRIEDARAVLKAGEPIEAKFLGVDRKNRTISLSIKAKDHDEESAAMKGYAREAQAGTATLGDILKQQMEEAGRG